MMNLKHIVLLLFIFLFFATITSSPLQIKVAYGNEFLQPKGENGTRLSNGVQKNAESLYTQDKGKDEEKKVYHNLRKSSGGGGGGRGKGVPGSVGRATNHHPNTKKNGGSVNCRPLITLLLWSLASAYMVCG